MTDQYTATSDAYDVIRGLDEDCMVGQPGFLVSQSAFSKKRKTGEGRSHDE
jgi:hypothetical protein